MKLIPSILLFMTSVLAHAQQKEILIIGTMHTVPKIVKHSYQPLLKLAYQYKPEAIYVESPMANDTISWNYLKNGWSESYKRFYNLSDSLRKQYDFNSDHLQVLLKIALKDLAPQQLDTLVISFAYLRDYANYKYYSYLKKYGINGPKKPKRNENEDLSYKLASKLNAPLFNMDDQQTNDAYHLAWTACLKVGATNGDNQLNNQLNKEDYNKSILPAVLGNLGKHTNKKKSLARMHALNSFQYVTKSCEPCDLATKYWDERNARMAKNIVDQVGENSYTKSVVIVGAGHVVGLKAAIAQQNPNLIVNLIDK